MPGEIESKFHDKTTVLSAMLEEQLKIYEAEKKTLEVRDGPFLGGCFESLYS